MTDWQKAGAHVAGYAVLTVGACALAARHGWPAVAALAVGVVLVVAALALEAVETVRTHRDVVARLAALEAAHVARDVVLEKAAKDAEAALAAAVRLTSGRGQKPPEY